MTQPLTIAHLLPPASLNLIDDDNDEPSSRPPTRIEQFEVLEEEEEVVVASNKWRPKISPYRLAVISLGAGLGTAKAWETARGESIAPITLEWISGVVISLCLFVLGWYDTPNAVNPLFAYDCLYPLCHLLFSTSSRTSSNLQGPSTSRTTFTHFLNTPPTQSQLRIDDDAFHPRITGYRFGVSIIVATFGLAKAACGYLGLSTAVNAVDWVFAVVVSTGLYILGLYEDSPDDALPSLFVTDYAEALRESGSILFAAAGYSLALSLCLFWSSKRSTAFRNFLGSPPYSLVFLSATSEHNIQPEDANDAQKAFGYTVLVLRSSVYILDVLLPLPLVIHYVLGLARTAGRVGVVARIWDRVEDGWDWAVDCWDWVGERCPSMVHRFFIIIRTILQVLLFLVTHFLILAALIAAFGFLASVRGQIGALIRGESKDVILNSLIVAVGLLALGGGMLGFCAVLLAGWWVGRMGWGWVQARARALGCGLR